MRCDFCKIFDENIFCYYDELCIKLDGLGFTFLFSGIIVVLGLAELNVLLGG